MELKQVKVGGVTYTIEERPFVDIGGGRDYQGCFRFTHSRIELLADLSHDRKHDVLCHELTHAIFYEAGYGSDAQDEDMINRIGKVLHQVLQDNDFSFMKK